MAMSLTALTIANQAQANSDVWQSFTTGQAHVSYGLIASGVIVILWLIYPKQAIWFAIALSIILAAIFSDLWANSYTH